MSRSGVFAFSRIRVPRLPILIYNSDVEATMHIVHVHVHVKPERVEAFRLASNENAGNSIKESGIARFDIIQQVDDPTRFILVEVYRTPDDQLKHRETAHYQKWRDTVAPMMAEPRSATKFVNMFPADLGWG
jgi:autoinducer 2-degrading protein